MWCDLVLEPARKKSGRARWALIWDNVNAHAVKSVRDVFNAAGITILDLPVNMTDILQPVDLVPNGPLKARTRRARTAQLYDYFQGWRKIADEETRGDRPLPPFLPPAPSQGAGISLISNVFDTCFKEEEYMDGVRRCFVQVGLAPGSDGKYATYDSHERGRSCAKAFRDVVSKTKLESSALLQDFFFGGIDETGQRLRDDDSSESDAEQAAAPETEAPALTAE
jgi:hypothetical protein